MKRNLTYLIIATLMSFLEVGGVKAENVYLLTAESINGTTGNYDVPSNHQFTYTGSNDIYTYTIDVSQLAGDFYFRVGVNGWDKNMQPYNNEYKLAINGSSYSISENCYGTDKTWKVTKDASYSTYTIEVKLTDGSRYVRITGEETPTPLTVSSAYYLIGDLSCLNITSEDKHCDKWGTDMQWGDNGLYRILKFKNNGDGTFSLKIPACRPTTTTDAASHHKEAGTAYQTLGDPVSFVIAPEEAFTSGSEDAATSKWTGTFDWDKVIRPSNGSNWIASAWLSGNVTTGGSNNFKAQVNGGSYTITLNPAAGTWSATYDDGVRIMYVAVKEDGYWRANQYITDEVTGTAFDGQHYGSFATDGNGILILHNWYAWQTDGSQTGWAGFSCRPYLQPMTFYTNSITDLSPVSKTTLDTKYITDFNIAGTYYTGVDPSNGSPTDIYSGMNPRPYGNFVGQVGTAAVNTVPIDMPLLAGKVIRTYSNIVDLDIPNGYKAYVAHSFNKDATTGNAENGTVNLRQIKYIPKNVGVVLVGEDASYAGTIDFPKYNGPKYYDSDDRTNLWSLKETNYSSVSGNANFNNYLIGSNNESVTIKNYEGEDENSPSTYTARNFGLNAYSHTKNGKAANIEEGGTSDFIGFFRAQGTVRANLAYLRIPSAPSSPFGYMDYNGQILDDQPDNQVESLSKTFITFDDELTNEETTTISSVAGQKTSDNSYYTLMGTRVEHPVKGIYVHNGKKIVVK